MRWLAAGNKLSTHALLGSGLMIFFVALPAQSFFLGTLTPYLTMELGVSPETVSFYFFLAFAGAAAWLQFVGRFIDQHGTVQSTSNLQYLISYLALTFVSNTAHFCCPIPSASECLLFRVLSLTFSLVRTSHSGEW